MVKVRSFAPASRADARVLILGSMPGPASLAAGQYYAHPQNQFWPFMGMLLDAGPELPYQQRLEKLAENGIALWDVMQECVRPTAMDADIIEASIVANDFENFLKDHPQIRRIFFNGSKAEQAFRRYVAPRLTGLQLTLLRLPSTSPANAGMARPQKLAAWRQILA